MTHFTEPASPAEDVERVQEMFGGKSTLGRAVKTELDAHELLDKGINGKALNHFVAKRTRVPREDVLKAIGMSERTYQRHKEAPDKRVAADQSGRAWKFAEILAEASAILGSPDEAELWLEREATGLNRQRPIDLLTTTAGRKLVTDYLTRMKYGVYT